MKQKGVDALLIGVFSRKKVPDALSTAEYLAKRINVLLRKSTLSLHAIGETNPVDLGELIDQCSVLLLEKDKSVEKTAALLKDILEKDSSKKVMVMADEFTETEEGLLMSSGARFLIVKPISEDYLKEAIEICVKAIEVQWWSLKGSNY